MTIRMCIGGGVATLDQATMDWCKWQGVAEVQIVVHHGNLPSPNMIHDNGIKTATLNPWNDVANGPGDPETVPGYAQAIAHAGWDMIAGEGVAGNVVADIENNVPYCNYAGAGAADGGQIHAYDGPWSHPRSGGKGHCDYIETYVGGGYTQTKESTIQHLNEAKAYGSIHYGPLVGMWNGYPLGLGDLIDIINRTGSDSVLFWCGYDFGALGQLRATTAGLWDGLKGQFGVTSGSSTTPAAAKPTAAAPAPPPENKVLSIAFSDGAKGETSRTVKTKDIINIVGKSGFKDQSGNWTAKPNPQMVWMWRIRTDRAGKEIYEDLGKQWPSKSGTFNYLVTWNKRETCKYKVGLVGT